jgi:hypothetical protein
LSVEKILLEAQDISVRRGAIGAWPFGFLERFRLSKFIVANLASALVLTAVSSVFAAPDPAQAPSAQASTAPAAQSPAAQATPTQTAKKKAPSPDDVICKPDSGTGSRVGGMKICMTRAEWRQRED